MKAGRFLFAGATTVLVASSFACRPVQFSAPGLTVPVFVGPVQPAPPRCAGTRATPVDLASYEFDDPATSGTTESLHYAPQSGRVTDQMVSLVLESATGYCEGCWVHLEHVSASDTQAGQNSLTLVEGRGRVTHIISMEGGPACPTPPLERRE